MVAAGAQAVGIMEYLLEATTTYVRERHQFGRPLASFQTVEHRLARMLIAVEEARAMAMLAAIRLASPVPERDLALSVSKAKIGAASRFVAQSAVQLHGGMGVSEDLPIARSFRKLVAYEARFGITHLHLETVKRFVTQTNGLGRSLIDNQAA